MQIESVHCNAINGDGTLLLKADVDEPRETLQYCFYVYKGSETIHKSRYSPKSWLEYKVDALGKYQIKAFVRDTRSSETISSVAPYVLKEKYAWKLAEAQRVQRPLEGEIGVKLERLSPGVLRAEAAESCDCCAWRVWREGRETA